MWCGAQALGGSQEPGAAVTCRHQVARGLWEVAESRAPALLKDEKGTLD